MSLNVEVPKPNSYKYYTAVCTSRVQILIIFRQAREHPNRARTRLIVNLLGF